MERKLFELFGLKFFVFENFQDPDLNIDDKSIYQFDNEEQLVDIFANHQFFTIWSDERRLNAGVICACEGNLNKIITYLSEIGIHERLYSTSNCGIRGEPSVLFLRSKKAMTIFKKSLVSEEKEKRLALTSFFGAAEYTMR
ncbi:MAG: hypothetical protein H0U73_13750 [Tatlockia sp.]|nr:hypothetical protein [Tatlockia sp.]